MGDHQTVSTARPAAGRRAVDSARAPRPTSTPVGGLTPADDLTTAAERAIHAVAQRLARNPHARAVADFQRLLNRPGRGRMPAPGTGGHAAAPVVQRRGENPHAKGGSHEGWELTDHHIIAHSKLVTALSKLTAEQKQQVLVAVIPDVLTKEMMANVKVPVSDTNTEPELRKIRRQLVNPDFNDEINNVRADDIRQSFFEWMGGNQFAGPNTSIRPEPSPSKDDIDTDGRFFTNANYGLLKGQADRLYSQLDRHKGLESTRDTLDVARKEEKPDTAAEAVNQEEIAASQTALKDVLLEIARIAKNAAPSSFDPSQWFEIKSTAQLEVLVASDAIDRAHIPSYTHFKMKTPSAMGPFPKPYEALKAVNAGISEFDYGDVKKLTCKVGGGYVYFPYEGSSDARPTNVVQRTVRDALTRIAQDANTRFDAVAARGDDDQYTLTLPGDKYQVVPGQRVKLKDFEGTFVATATSPALKIAAGTLEAPLRENLPGQTLHDYLRERNTPISSWLPKGLHSVLRFGMPTAIEESLQRAIRDQWRWSGLLAGAQRLKPTKNTQKTIALRTRQLEDAKAKVKTYREQLAQAKKFWGDI